MDKTETLQAWNYDGTPRTLTWMNRSPISGKWQIPAGVTTTKPPKAKAGYTLTFDGGKWTQTKEETKEEPKPAEPTAEELKAQELAQLDAEYESAKKTLAEYYIDALIHGDTDLMDELKAEMLSLDEEYASEREGMEG